MKKFLALMLVFSLFFAFGCKKDEEKVNEFETLVNYLESDPGGQWVNTLSGWILNYNGLNLDNYFILDIRKAEHFVEPYKLPNATNSTMAEMFDKVAGATKPVLAVCYSGQSASYAHTLLRLKGVEAYVLKFGMSIVNKDLDKWTNNCASTLGQNAAWVKTASPALPSFDYPELDTGKKDAEDILDKRIDAAVSAGLKLISATDAINDRANYNIINYWNTSDAGIGGQNPYTVLGHIDGAYQVPMKTMKTTENLKTLDPDGTNILYCWTGQTAAATTSYLTVLGYDVKSIKFGVNAIIWDQLPGHKWPKPW